jgi:hypothetical protein
LLRIDAGTAGLTSAAISVSVAVIAYWLADNGGSTQASALVQRLKSNGAPLAVFGMLFTANLAMALLIKLYRAAVLDKATPEERSLGIVGFRAWLSPLNVITVVCIAIGACLALGEVDYVACAIIGLATLLAYPLVNTVFHQSPSFAKPHESASSLKAPYEERERVLALVEAGKITAEDGAELLTALAQSHAASSNAAGAMSGPRRIMLVGAGITLVGFFLPWFTVNVAQAMGDLTHSLMQGTSQFPGNPQPNINVDMNGTPIAVPNGMRIDVRGGDVQHGLGWIILAAGLGAACLPFFWPAPAGNTRQTRNAVFAALAVGSVLALYVLSGSFNAAISIEPGFVLAMAGYIVLWVGGVREYITPIGRLQPALAVV